VPVIYMTGNDSLDVQKAALASGCIAFLKKPFAAQELIEPLRKAEGHLINTGHRLSFRASWS
jgi:FixJ family two-component response regulator